MKYTFLLAMSLLLVTGYNAKAQVAIYMRSDYEGEVTLDIDSAAFKRVVYDIDSNNNVYPIVDYYLDGKLKGRGLANIINPFNYVGQRVEYYKNGNKRMMGHFTNGRLTGPVYRYYQNGKLYAIQEYPPSKIDSNKEEKTVNPIIVALKDSSGADMIKDGVGHYIEYDEYDPKIVTAEGDILNGKWEGEVKGFLPREGLKYTEVYKAGVLVSGLSVDSLGNEYKYSEGKIPPDFKGGRMMFYKFLQKKMQYPEPALEKTIEGKAVVKFRVHADGNISNFEITNYVNAELGKEAIRTFKAAGNWIPAKVKGKPVNSILMVPVSFKLN